MSMTAAAQLQARKRGGGGATTSPITWIAGGSDTVVAGARNLAPALGAYAANDVAVVFAMSDNSATIVHTGPPGYTLIFDDAVPTPDRPRRVSAWYKVLTASESAPTVGSDKAEARTAVVNLFRGLDTGTPLDTPYVQATHREVGASQDNPTPRSIMTMSAGSALLVLQGQTNAQVTDAGAPSTPSGMLAGVSLFGDHRNAITAYLLDAGAAGTKTFSAMNNTNGALVGSYAIYTLALRAATI